MPLNSRHGWSERSVGGRSIAAVARSVPEVQTAVPGLRFGAAGLPRLTGRASARSFFHSNRCGTLRRRRPVGSGVLPPRCARQVAAFSSSAPARCSGVCDLAGACRGRSRRTTHFLRDVLPVVARAGRGERSNVLPRTRALSFKLGHQACKHESERLPRHLSASVSGVSLRPNRSATRRPKSWKSQPMRAT